MNPTAFDDIRPYHDEELPAVYEELIADPALGNFTMTTSQFKKFWEPQVIFIVYPKAGEERDAGFALSDSDLSFIGEDRIRRTALLEIPGFWSALQPTNFRSIGIR